MTRALSTLLCVFLVLMVMCLLQCYGQSCQTGCEMELTVCSSLDYLLYVPVNASLVTDQENLAAAAIARVALVQTFNPTCYDAFKLFVCNMYHPSCNMEHPDQPEQIRLCVDICYNLHAVCGSLLNIVPAPTSLLFDCSNTTLYTNKTSAYSCAHSTNTTPLCSNSSQGYLGVCQEFNASLAPQFGEICAPFTSRYVWMPDNGTDAITRKDSIQTQFTNVLKLSIPITPIECYQSLLSALCSLLFPTCIMVAVPGVSEPVPVGQMACMASCLKSMEICSSFFNILNTSKNMPKNCSSFPFPEVDPYPVQLQNETVYIPCRTAIFPEDPYALWTIPPNPCPPETGRKKHPGPTDAPCGLKCPDASYTSEEWHTIVVLTQSGSAISLVCMFFLLVSYLVNVEKRKFPTSLHLNEFVATFLFSLSFLIGGAHPEQDVWCMDEGTNATQKDNIACAAQGFFFIVFGLALAAWCAVIAFIIFFSLIRPQGSITALRDQLVYFNIFAWIFPLAFGVAAIASGNIGYGPPLAWCFIHFNGFGFGSGLSKDYPLFYIPIGILFTIILILFWTSTGVIAYIRKRRSHVSGFDIFIRTQIRVLIFIFVIFAIFFTIFEWRFAIQARNDTENLQTVGLTWTYCKIQTSLGLPTPGNCPGNTNPARIDYKHTVFESFLLSGIGILIFIAFSSDKQIYSHWAIIVQLFVNGEWDALHNLVLKGQGKKAKPSGSGGSAPQKASNGSSSETTKKSFHNEIENVTVLGSSSDSMGLALSSESVGIVMDTVK